MTDEVILKPRCPFKGLSAFTEKDADSFYGREEDTARVRTAVRTQPLTLVVGPSGCGKSSLMRAGVLPRLRAEGMSVSELRTVRGVRPAAMLARALVGILDPCLGEGQRFAAAEELAGLLESGDDVPADLRARVLARAGSVGHVLFLDQFEEYESAKPAAARTLLGMIAALAGKDGATVLRVVATARPDSLEGLVTASTSDLVSDAVQFLVPLADDDLERAVTGPVDATPELWFESGLPKRIVADAGDEHGRMSRVQFALAELWSRRVNATLTHTAYAEMGGVAGALEGYAEATLEGLPQAQRVCAQRLFEQLALPVPGNTFSLLPARVDDLAPGLFDLAQKMADRKLVVLRHAPGDGKPEDVVELPHKALIELWPRLRQWLIDYLDFRRWQAYLRDDLYHWKRAGRPSSHLLTGSQLAEALRWFCERPEDISPDERDYILRSRRRFRWRAGRAVPASGTMGRVAMSMKQGGGSERRHRWRVRALLGLWIAVLLAAASISVHDVLQSFRLHAGLGPSDTPAVVTAIVALATATGTLIGVTLTAWAKYVQARGQSEADLIRARAEMMRAEADVQRARAGLPPITPSGNGESPASTPPAELDASSSGGGI